MLQKKKSRELIQRIFMEPWMIAIGVCLLLLVLYLSKSVLFPSQTVSKARGTMTLYYAPWCGHCKHFMPEYEKFRELAVSRHQGINVTKVDCTKEKCPNIRGYPTVQFTDGNNTKEFSGQRTADSLSQFAATC